MNSSLLEATLVRADRVRAFHIRQAFPTGWETLESEGQRLVRQQRHTDWHRVEVALASFKREIAELKEQGWREA
jgi:hypothetical protein